MVKIPETSATHTHPLSRLGFCLAAILLTGVIMKPINFKEANMKLAENQPEYLTLPVHKDSDGIVTSCWQANFWERLWLFFTGKIFVQQMTFNKPLQPQKIVAGKLTLTNSTGWRL